VRSMPDRFEIYLVYKRRYINTLLFLFFLLTALAVLNRPLRSLDVCCLWLTGLWHGTRESVSGGSATSHTSLAAHTLLA